jgi:hypothetical protein
MTPNPGPPAGGGPTLLELAEQRFAPLSDAEKELFQAAQAGREASTLARHKRENDPAKSEKWGAERVARAECIAWIFTEPRATILVNYRGLDLRGMKIKGDLDLSKAKIPFFLSAEKCVFLGSILLRRAEVRELYFSKCYIKKPKTGQKEFKALDAEEAKISGSLSFRDGSKAEGEVSLLGIALGGDLDCRESQFSNPGRDALSADGARIEGDVLLGECKIRGKVRLSGAAIGGNLECSAAQFRTRKGGLNGDGMKVGGDVLFDDHFHAQGVVSLSEANITGNLDCSGGHFSKPRESLRLEGASIEGNVLFTDFEAGGEVILLGTSIGGSLECVNSKFLHPGDALTADGAKIKGTVTFGSEAPGGGFQANGTVRLFGTAIEGDLDCNWAQFTNAKDALSADGAEITGDVKFNYVHAGGPMRFPGATIGGNLECYRIQFKKSKKEAAFNADSAKIEGTVFFWGESVVEGEVVFVGATIEGDFACVGAKFSTPGGAAISADRAKIGGNVRFDDGFQAEGKVSFLGAMIAGDLECDRAKFSNGKYDALSAEAAKIEGSVTLRKRLKLQGLLNLENANVRHRLNLRGFSVPAEATINLGSATVGAIHGDEANLESTGNLLLDGFTYAGLQISNPDRAESWIKWLQEQPRDEFVPQPYEQLAMVLRRMGYERDARRVMIAKNRDRARFTWFPHQSWWWYDFFGWAIGYGYAPWRAFAISMGMILFGALLFYLGDSHHLISPTKEETSAQSVVAKSKNSPPFDPIIYSLESFTPLLKLGQSANWSPNSNQYAFQTGHYTVPFTGTFLRYYLYFHIILGWLLTSLWVGALTGLVKS